MGIDNKPRLMEALKNLLGDDQVQEAGDTIRLVFPQELHPYLREVHAALFDAAGAPLTVEADRQSITILPRQMGGRLCRELEATDPERFREDIMERIDQRLAAQAAAAQAAQSAGSDDTDFTLAPGIMAYNAGVEASDKRQAFIEHLTGLEWNPGQVEGGTPYYVTNHQIADPAALKAALKEALEITEPYRMVISRQKVYMEASLIPEDEPGQQAVLARVGDLEAFQARFERAGMDGHRK